jgi:hypothetical protein
MYSFALAWSQLTHGHKKSTSDSAEQTTNNKQVIEDTNVMLPSREERSNVVPNPHKLHRMFDVIVGVLVCILGLWEPGPLPVTMLGCLFSNLFMSTSSPLRQLAPTSLEDWKEIIRGSFGASDARVIDASMVSGSDGECSIDLDIDRSRTNGSEPAQGETNGCIGGEGSTERLWLEQGDVFWQTKRKSDTGTATGTTTDNGAVVAGGGHMRKKGSSSKE